MQQRSTAQVPLGPQSGTLVTSVRVGAGTWALRANLSAVDFGTFDFAECELVNGASDLGDQQVVVGHSDVIVSNFVVQGAFTTTKSATVQLLCSAAQTTGVYIDPGATLTATLVPTPANLVSGEGGGLLSDTGGAQTKVFHEKLPAGAWRVSSVMTTDVANPNGSIGGATDFVRCTLLAGTRSIDGGATVLINTVDSAGDYGNFEQAIVNTGTFTAKQPWTLNVSCSHDRDDLHRIALAGGLLQPDPRGAAGTDQGDGQLTSSPWGSAMSSPTGASASSGPGTSTIRSSTSSHSVRSARDITVCWR